MKRKITQLKSSFRKLFGFSIMTIVGFGTNEIMAQATSPAPYCKPTYTAMTAGPCTSNLQFRVGAISFRELNYDELAVCPTTVTSDYRYFPQSIITSPTVQPGNNYVISVTSASGGSGNARSVGIWVDWNKNNVFDADEFLSTGTNLATHTQGTIFTRNLNVPCGTQPGTYRFRVTLSASNLVTNTMACQTTSFGETWDFDLIVLPLETLPKPDFIVPANVYVNTPVRFTNSTINVNRPGFNFSFQWDLDNNGVINSTAKNFETVFATAGMRVLKLRVPGCGVSDSIIKNVNVINPTQAPIADFYANKTLLEQGDEVMLVDLSTHGPDAWNWLLEHTSTGITFDNSSSSPLGFASAAGFGGRFNRILFELYLLGTFDASLNASNGHGPSTKKKFSYIEVEESSIFVLGDGRFNAELGKGTIYSDNGPNGLYPVGTNGRPQFNRLAIRPCGATQITLQIERFKLGNATHNLKIWDGPNAVFSTPLHPPGGFTRNNTTAPLTLIARSGSFYLELDTEAGVAANRDSGIIIRFESDYGVVGSPQASFIIGDNQTVAYRGANTILKSTSLNIYGQPTYTWTVNGTEIPSSAFIDPGRTGTDVLFNFNTVGNVDVCLDIESCVGTTRTCQTLTVVNPTSPTDIDFFANEIRPNAFENITLSSITDKANRFRWEIFPPNAFTFVEGTNATMREIKGNFSQTGAYTVTLRAWNSNDSATTVNTLTKQDYVVVVRYCSPAVEVVSSDIAIRNVRITENLLGRTLLNFNSGFGSVGYEDFTSDREFFTPLFVGGTYSLTLSRASNVNRASHAVFIDFNSDGFFTLDERVMFINNSNQSTHFGTFKVPSIDAVYTTAPVRMRVVSTNGSNDPIPCGPLQVGEFEDYLIKLNVFEGKPNIDLVGADTIRIEQGAPYNEPGFVATDLLEGNLNNNVIVNSNLVNTNLGVYRITYDVKNASGVSADQKSRIVVVSIDRTPPVLTLLGKNPDTLDVNTGNYVDLGFTAIDAVDGDVSQFAIVESNVRTDLLGTYQINYSASDLQGNISQKVRTVVVVDRVAPVINIIGRDTIELGRFWTDQTTVTDNYWPTSQIQFTKTFGLTGQVRWDQKGVYTVNYTAIDGSNNMSTATRVYVVDDVTPPTIILNSSDTILHNVNTIYTPIQPTISDNSYSLSEISVVRNANINTSVLGLYSETYTATDGSGNVATSTRWIRVVDRVAPTIIANDICSKVGFDFNSLNTISIADNYYSSEELLELVEVISSNVNPYFIGNYAASYRVTDPSGNTSLITNQRITISEDCDIITSVASPNFKLVMVYPNPSSSNFNISSSKSTIKSINVYDNIGNIVIRFSEKEIVSNTVNLDLSSYANGVYHLNVVTAEGTESHKLILTK